MDAGVKAAMFLIALVIAATLAIVRVLRGGEVPWIELAVVLLAVPLFWDAHDLAGW